MSRMVHLVATFGVLAVLGLFMVWTDDDMTTARRIAESLAWLVVIAFLVTDHLRRR